MPKDEYSLFRKKYIAHGAFITDRIVCGSGNAESGFQGCPMGTSYAIS